MRDTERLLRDSIERRARRRRLRLTADHLRYANARLLGPIPRDRRGRALYVGCGHGHDALLALVDGQIDSVVGVDPYEQGGNDSEDHAELAALIAAAGLADRFTVHRSEVQPYLRQAAAGEFDLVVCADVLHHIFETRAPLVRSPLFGGAVELFTELARACSAPRGTLAISDVRRRGLRPLLKRMGIVTTHIHYETKQDWREWRQAAVAGGWRFDHVENYVPYAFRRQRCLWSGALGGATLCDRYFLYFDLYLDLDRR